MESLSFLQKGIDKIIAVSDASKEPKSCHIVMTVMERICCILIHLTESVDLKTKWYDFFWFKMKNIS